MTSFRSSRTAQESAHAKRDYLKPLTRGELRTCCDPSVFAFETTEELCDLETPPGQERALSALDLGIGMERGDYNIYALGPPGLGKQAIVQGLIGKKAALGPPPDDWVYVYNFKDPNKPQALRLPAGRGRAFHERIETLVNELRAAIPSAFESGDFQKRKEAIEEELRERRNDAFTDIEAEAKRRGMIVIQTPTAFLITPMRDGKPVDPATFERWAEKDREEAKAQISELQQRLQNLLQDFPKWERDAHRDIRELAKEVTQRAVTHLVEEVCNEYSDVPLVCDYVSALKGDVIRNANAFLEAHAAASVAGLDDETVELPAFFARYTVNLFTDNSDTKGKPVIYEDTPTYQNVVGTIEYRSEMGNLVTDFTLLKPGALHRANGGYLILRAHGLLSEPFAYDALKRALRAGHVKLQSAGRMFSLVSTKSLEPEPIPTDVKVVLIGDRLLYYLLSAYDPDFDQIFKVAVDFDEDIKRTDENAQLAARMIATLARREKLGAFDKQAVARIIEHAMRYAGATDRISVHGQELTELLCEADHFARLAGKNVVGVGEVNKALDAQIYRIDRVRERIQEQIRDGTIIIDVAGEKAGQIKGLAVSTLGRFTFARPTRITATARPGRGQVIDIEREAELSGPIHAKGVLILQRYIASRFAHNLPLSLSASLVFEQSYGMIEGDSASAAELFALLSAIADVPLKQSFAVTGSVNQRGDIQAIGAVNEKIEGFFDVCRFMGLTGDQGVIIPASNIKNLMLREEVLEAVDEGKFHVHAITSIDEGLELLSGLKAGSRGDDGAYEAGSFNRLVDDRLIEFAEALKRFHAEESNSNGGADTPT